MERIAETLRNEELMSKLLEKAIAEVVKMKSEQGRSSRRGQVERDALIMSGLTTIALALSLDD
jgi:hypothetical protein